MYLKRLLQFFRRPNRRESTMDEQSIVHYFNEIEHGAGEEQIDHESWTDEQHHQIYQRIRGAVDQQQTAKRGAFGYAATAVVAAIIILLIGYTVFDQFKSAVVLQEFATGTGEVKDVILADGTHVWLNNMSRLTYAESKQERKIQLSGEAYFDVASKAHHPFTVQVGDMLVEVLGTSFNVRAHIDEPMMQVSVQSGSIAVSGRPSANKQIKPVHVHANEQLTYHIHKGEFDAVKQLWDTSTGDWRSGILQYQAVPLRLIIGDLERSFGIRIIAEKKLLDCPISAVFDDDPLTKILTILASTMEGDVIYEKGTYKLTGKSCN